METNQSPLLETLEDLNISENAISEIMSKFAGDTVVENALPEDKVFELQGMLDKIPKENWRKRAKIAARIISENLK